MTTPQTAAEWQTLEQKALTDPEALTELARVSTTHLVNPAWHKPEWITRVQVAYREGFTASEGTKNPYQNRNNFYAPLRRAWRWGQLKRQEIGQ